MLKNKLLIVLSCLAMAACSTLAPPQGKSTSEITLFSFNDFHGNLQSDQPIPLLVNDVHGHSGHDDQRVAVPSGGYAYFSALLKQRRAAKPNSILVGAGDLIGASPIGSAILRDEPVIEAMNQMDLAVTSLGNHEFDIGSVALKYKLEGKCPQQTCLFKGFHGANYDYIAANVVNKTDNRPWLKPYVIRQVGDVKVAFIGAVTADTPNIVAGDAVKTLRFEDEAEAANRYVPEIQQQGVAAIVLLIHEGGNYAGAANDPSYRCEGLKGPIIDIVKRLDKAIDMVISGHTHQGYTCKIDGRLVVQARSFGGYLTETTLTIDKQTKHVIAMEAVNHLVEQARITPDAQAQILVDQVAQQTAEIRNRVVATLAAPLTRKTGAGRFDHSLGNMVADAQLHAAAAFGGADISFMNEGGLRTDLPQGVPGQPITLTFGDLYAVQPFGSQLVTIKMTGAQILSLLQQQWQGRSADNPKRLFVSQGFSYQWRASAPLEQRVSELKLRGEALQANKEYTVVTNSFLAGGGDGFSVFKQGKNQVSIGRDIDATVAYLAQFGSQLKAVNIDRVRRID